MNEYQKPKIEVVYSNFDDVLTGSTENEVGSPFEKGWTPGTNEWDF